MSVGALFAGVHGASHGRFDREWTRLARPGAIESTPQSIGAHHPQIAFIQRPSINNPSIHPPHLPHPIQPQPNHRAMGTATKKPNKRKGGGPLQQARAAGAGTGRIAQKLLAARGGKGGAAGMVNPFDAVGNRKAKFEVLNKRAKGQVRNVAK